MYYIFINQKFSTNNNEEKKAQPRFLAVILQSRTVNVNTTQYITFDLLARGVNTTCDFKILSI